MTTYTITLDLIKNIKPEDIMSVLYRLINEECTDCIAIDNEMKLLRIYYKYSLWPDYISSWIKYLSDHSQCYTSINYVIVPERFSDKDVLFLTAQVIGDKKMVVNSFTSVKEYVDAIDGNNGQNEAIVGDVRVQVITCNEAKKAINNTKTTNIVKSIIATENSKIKNVEIK